MGFAHRSLDDFHEYQDMSEYKNVLRGSIFTAMDQVEGFSALKLDSKGIVCLNSKENSLKCGKIMFEVEMLLVELSTILFSFC